MVFSPFGLGGLDFLFALIIDALQCHPMLYRIRSSAIQKRTWITTYSFRQVYIYITCNEMSKIASTVYILLVFFCCIPKLDFVVLI